MCAGELASVNRQRSSSHLLPLLDGHKASELGDYGVLLADVDDERLPVSLHNLDRKTLFHYNTADTRQYSN